MGAAPAYSYYPERATQRASRERISVVAGRGARANVSTPSSSIVFLAKAAAVVLVIVALVCFARITLSSAAVTTSMQVQQLENDISAARADGASLEVTQSLLSNPTHVKQQATGLKMAAPETVGTIALEQDIVVADESGALSLSKSVAVAAGAGA